MISRTFRLLGSALAGFLLLAGLMLILNTFPAFGQPDGAPAEPEPPLVPNRPPTQPFEPYGYVTDNGSNVPLGTVIGAVCADVGVPPTTAVFPVGTEMGYFLAVPGDDPDTVEKEGCFPGEMIRFEIDGQLAYQTATWVLGDNPQIDLTTGTPDPAIELRMLTQGQPASIPPGPYVAAGEPVTWTYIVSSTGNVSLNAVSVIDDRGTPADSGDDSTVCTVEHLALGAVHTCVLSATAILGSYTNTATAAGSFNGDSVSQTVSAHYQGITPGLVFSLLVNGQNADTAPGPTILIGERVTWTYQVTNTGGITLALVTFWDDSGPAVCEVDNLGPNESDSCSPPAGLAIAGQHVKNARAEGTFLHGSTIVSGTDKGHYFGAAPALWLEKSTDGQDADEAPGPKLELGKQVTWDYVVTNTGNVPLVNIIIRDDNGTLGIDADDFDICVIADLLVGNSESCTKGDSLVILGQYSNTGLATTIYASQTFTDSDRSHYLGVEQLEWLIFLPAIRQ